MNYERLGAMFVETNRITRPKYGNTLHSDPNLMATAIDDHYPMRNSSDSDVSSAYDDSKRRGISNDDVAMETNH